MATVMRKEIIYDEPTGLSESTKFRAKLAVLSDEDASRLIYERLLPHWTQYCYGMARYRALDNLRHETAPKLAAIAHAEWHRAVKTTLGLRATYKKTAKDSLVIEGGGVHNNCTVVYPRDSINNLLVEFGRVDINRTEIDQFCVSFAASRQDKVLADIQEDKESADVTAQRMKVTQAEINLAHAEMSLFKLQRLQVRERMKMPDVAALPRVMHKLTNELKAVEKKMTLRRKRLLKLGAVDRRKQR